MTSAATSGPNRRTVLCGLALGVAAPGALAACAPLGRGGQNGGGVGSLKSGTVVGKVSDVPIGGGVLETVNNDVLVLLVAPSPGVIKAFDPTCPHAGATVGAPQGGVITCPAHGSQFNAATGALERGPAQQGLTVVPVTIKGDNVVLA